MLPVPGSKYAQASAGAKTTAAADSTHALSFCHKEMSFCI